MEALLLYPLVALGAVIGLVIVVAVLYRRFHIASQPDEWLLCVRDGALVHAGVGTSCWRRPGDVVVRFSSTIQRVRFTAEARSLDGLEVEIEGFVLWSVAEGGDGPFRAFQKMGFVRLGEQSGEMRARKHLLTTPQHRAFRKLVSAEAQRHAAKLDLAALMQDPDGLVAGLEARLARTSANLGVNFDQVQIIHARAADPKVMEALASEEREAVLDASARMEVEVEERKRLRALESRARIMEQEHRDAQQRQQLEHTRSLEIIEASRISDRQRQEATHALSVQREQDTAALTAARLVRKREELQAALAEVRQRAEADRDAALLRLEAESVKTDEIRAYELERHRAEHLTEAFAALPLKEARWVTMSEQSPLSSLIGMLGNLKEIS